MSASKGRRLELAASLGLPPPRGLRSLPCVEIPDTITDYNEKLKYIAEKVKQSYNNAVRYFLLQCGDWSPSEFYANTWKASVGYVDDFIYGIGNEDVELSDETNITVSSWKGNHEDVHLSYAPRGNLPYDGPMLNYKGNIWTRGE